MQRALSLLGRRSFASPAFAPATISGLSPNKVAEATALGFHPADTAIIAFGAGAVNNTLLSLMSQVSEDLAIVSTHAEHIAAEGVSLQHRGDEYVVPPGVITIKEAACDKNPRIILNGRQVPAAARPPPRTPRGRGGAAARDVEIPRRWVAVPPRPRAG
mmetsp:Transcript_6816/g.21460  ORF Transcript_6816/g.21460 Transcript_6816/m.21460 type:complete len:159 (+) Transcript_6816:2383-2859(+)